MASEDASSTAQDIDIGSFIWEPFEDESITDEDLQAVSAQLEICSWKCGDLEGYLSLPHDSSNECVTGVDASLASTLLKKWKAENAEARWGGLISCLKKSADSTLMGWIKEHLEHKNRGITVAQNGALSDHMESHTPPSDTVLGTFTERMEHPHGSVEECREPFQPAIQEECIPHYEQVVPGLSDQGIELTPENLSVKPNMEQLQTEFDSLLNVLLQALCNKKISVKVLKVFLMQLCVDQQENIYYFDRKMIQLEILTTHERVFAFLTKVGAWTFLHYYLVEEINTEYKLEANGEITSYKSRVETFLRETTLNDFLIVCNSTPDHQPYSCPGYTPLIVKVKACWPTYTLAKVAEVEGYLAGEFKLKKLIFRIENGTFGCVYLMWLVPKTVAEHMQLVMKGPEWPKQLACDIEELSICWKECEPLGLRHVNLITSDAQHRKHSVVFWDWLNKQCVSSRDYTTSTAVMCTQTGFSLNR